MRKHKRLLEPDENKLAASIVERATSEHKPNPKGKNPHAVALGRLGGQKGGPARARNLSKKRRIEIAKKAANTRWVRSGNS